MLPGTSLQRSLLPLMALAALAASTALLACGPTPSSVVPTSPAAAPSGQPTPGGATSGAPKRGGTFVDVAFGDAVTMQPLLAQDSASSDRIGMVYSSLLRYNKQMELEGELAKAYKVSDDKLSISFELKDNLVWSDGQPITADDVKFTWDRMMDEKVDFPYRSLYEPLGSVEVTGPRSFVFRLKEVFAPALEYAGGIQPIPQHIFGNVDINQNEFNDKPPVSSGPFIFKEWVKDDHATFVANDRYWDGRPNLDTYIFRVVKDATVSYSMLKIGDADTSDIQPQDYDEATKSAVFNSYRFYTASAPWDYVGFNLRNPILSDRRVRYALSYGLDTQKMIDRIRLGFAKPQYSVYPATSPVFTDQVAKFGYDPAKAKALLDEAGWTVGADGIRVKDGQKLKLRIHFNAGNKRREQIATIAQQYWKDIGVDVEVDQEEWGAFLKRVNETHDFDMVVLGWVGGFEPNAQSNIWMTGKPQNSIGYSNPRVDELFRQGVTVSYDMKDRKPVYEEIQKIIAEDQPYIFLFTQESIAGVNKRIKGVDPEPLGLRWNADKWYSETGQ